ncbi:MAG: magnesium transporter NIPA-domain-containing protein [Benniella sp.]|nr:MAG: magnesium transporter NIPA-domain-containing protein [Benniella sp.]
MLYLRSKAWWLGMTLMILGECGNFLAYGYAQASIIAPLGTVALVSNVILAPLMLKEPFRKRDLLGIVIAIVGTVVVVINSKESDVKLTPEAVVAALLRTRFVVYFIICCSAVAVLASLSDTIGSKYIFIDLSIVGIFGGYTVLATKGLSSLLSLSFYKMFTYPIAYLLVFVLVSTAVLQIKFLNKSLQRFDSTQVIPTQFVLFTTSAIIGSGILYNDFDEMDFQKGSNFLAGCLMTFIGVYFITSNRKTDSGKPALETTEWAMASQSQFVPSHHHRTSLDSYTAGRSLYPSEQTRADSFMEQGRAPPQSIGYVIPQPRSGRPTRHSMAAEAIGPNTPLMGTSSRQSIAGSKDQIANLTNALAGSHHTTLLLGNSGRYHLRDELVLRV